MSQKYCTIEKGLHRKKFYLCMPILSSHNDLFTIKHDTTIAEISNPAINLRFFIFNPPILKLFTILLALN